jgi:hypothetical protein
MDVWDFMDQIHKPTLVKLISGCFTKMEFSSSKLSQSKQYIIMGDDSGSFHIVEVPSKLSKKQEIEDEIIKKLWDKETRRYLHKESRIKELKDMKAKDEFKVVEKEAAKVQEEDKQEENEEKELELEELYKLMKLTIRENELGDVSHEEADRLRKEWKEAKTE